LASTFNLLAKKRPLPAISLCSFIACLPCPHPLLTLCLGICLRQLSTSNIQSVFSNVRVGVAGKAVRDVQSLNWPLLREFIVRATLYEDAPMSLQLTQGLNLYYQISRQLCRNAVDSIADTTTSPNQREMVLRVMVLPVVLPVDNYGHDDLVISFHPSILQTKCWDNINIMQVVSMDGSSSNGFAKLSSVCHINNFRLLCCLVGVQWDVWIPRHSWLFMSSLQQPSYSVPFEMQCVAEYFKSYVYCYLYQVATILPAITLPEGAQVNQVRPAFPYYLGPPHCQVCFKLPWMKAVVKQYLYWSLHIQSVTELSNYLLVACLLCPHLLLTLCSWKHSSLTAVSSLEYSACPSNVRVGVDNKSVPSSKSSVVHPSIQAPSLFKLSVALLPSLLWMSVLEGAFSSILVLQSVKPSVLEIFLHIIQVFKRLINLSTAIHFPNYVRKMRECCPGLTEQISCCDLSREREVHTRTRIYSRSSPVCEEDEMHRDVSAMPTMSYRRMIY